VSAKQSAVLVARAKKRRTLRDELRARCGVFNETDHGTSENAPEGWVEIQRFASIDREFGSKSAEPFESDEHAALAVAELGGARGTAMHYECGAGLFEPVDLAGLGTSPERWTALAGAAEILGGDHYPDEDGLVTFTIDPSPRRRGRDEVGGSWICIVPRSVAIAAGLLS
jgi:hypothetical protein